MNKNKRIKDTLTIGLALFSMYFGAGNLIFPPLLGQNTEGYWPLGFLFFFCFDMGLAVIAILAVIHKEDDSMDGITGVMGKIPSIIINCAIILCLGPLLAIPRTAATTYEISIAPNWEGINSWIFSIIFFTMVLLLTLRPTKVIDIIGNYLTPILFLSLLILIIKGVLIPLGTPDGGNMAYAIKEGTLNGYQTLDPLGSMIFIMLIIGNAKSKGYSQRKELSEMTIRSSLIAAVLLFVVYGGLTYLGAATQNISDFQNLSQTELIIKIILRHFGTFGMILLGLIVMLACLTTAIGLTSAMGNFFDKLTGEKVSYKVTVFLTCLFSCLMANLGVSTIIEFSGPILMILYPGILTLVTLAFFHNKITKANIYRFPVYFAMLTSLLEILEVDVVSYLPFSKFGFAWLVPAILGGIVGKLLPSGENQCLRKKE